MPNRACHPGGPPFDGRKARYRFLEATRLGLLGLLATLVGFHLWLLYGRILDRSLAEPAVFLKWLAAAALTWALCRLPRKIGLVGERRQILLWLAILLLHLVGPKHEVTEATPSWLLPVCVAVTLGTFGLLAETCAGCGRWPKLLSSRLVLTLHSSPETHLHPSPGGPRAPPYLLAS